MLFHSVFVSSEIVYININLVIFIENGFHYYCCTTLFEGGISVMDSIRIFSVEKQNASLLGRCFASVKHCYVWCCGRSFFLLTSLGRAYQMGKDKRKNRFNHSNSIVPYAEDRIWTCNGWFILIRAFFIDKYGISNGERQNRASTFPVFFSRHPFWGISDGKRQKKKPSGHFPPPRLLRYISDNPYGGVPCGQ